VFALADGRQVCGYIVAQADGTETLDEWRAVLRADAELVALRKDAALVDRMRAELGGQIVDLRAAAESTARGLAICEEHAAERSRELVDTHNELNEERGKPRFGSLGWGVAAIAAAILVGYVGADQL